MNKPSSLVDYVNLQVISPEQVFYEGLVNWVQVPLSDGLLGIWPQHAPLIASVAQGTVHFEEDEGVREMAVEGGILQIGVEQCTILVGLPASMKKSPSSNTGALVDDMQKALQESLSDDEIQALQEG